jgi:hypothetical protein
MEIEGLEVRTGASGEARKAASAVDSPRSAPGQLRLQLEASAWEVSRDGDRDCLALYERHYSCKVYRDGRVRKLFCGPGFKLVLVTPTLDALFVWRKFRDDAIPRQRGINCAIFRNEGRQLSSALILAAEPFARRRWPRAKRFYTYINADKTASRRGKANPPGYCFIRAGWTPCGTTRGGLLILKKLIGRGA